MDRVIFLLSFLFFFQHYIFGSSTCIGGGGHILQCGKSINLYDHAEQKILTSFHLDMAGENFREKVIFVLERLKKFDPLLAKELNTYSLQIMDNLEDIFHREGTFPDLKDYSQYLEFEGCLRLPFAIQYHNPLPYQKKYLINYKIWEKVDEITRAGIILHESIYTYRIRKGDQTSDFTRFYNFVISSNFMQNATIKEYQKIKNGHHIRFLSLVKKGIDTLYEESEEKFKRIESAYEKRVFLGNFISKMVSIMIDPQQNPPVPRENLPSIPLHNNPLFDVKNPLSMEFYSLLGNNDIVPTCEMGECKSAREYLLFLGNRHDSRLPSAPFESLTPYYTHLKNFIERLKI